MENARKVALSGLTNLVIRVPVIPTFNDTVEEIQRIAGFADTLPGVNKIHLLRITDWDRTNMRGLEEHI